MREYRRAFGEALNAADLLIRGIKEVAFVGEPNLTETQSLLAVLNNGYYPNAIAALAPSDAGADAVPPLLAERGLVDGKPAAYVCEHFVCQRPVTEPEALQAALNTQSANDAETPM